MYLGIFLIGLIILVPAVLIFMSVNPTLGQHNKESVRKKIKEYLYEKYEEEFVVDRIGTRKDDEDAEYVARIYPQSIVGTRKEGEEYYYGRASIDKLSFGRLKNPGDNYSYVKLNLGAEKYLLPKLKEIFGKRVLMKADAQLKVWGKEKIVIEAYREKYGESDGTEAFVGYKESNFKKARKRVVNDPEHNKLFLDLYVYVFDRIDNSEEKEERRKDIFQFVQYLKEEGLFRYLELGVIFIDERVLAPSYKKYRKKVIFSNKVKEIVVGKTVNLPPEELRKELSEKLKNEIIQMNEKELLTQMKKIQKSDLSYEGINKYNAQASCYIYSPKLLNSRYKTALEKGILEEKKYLSASEVVIKKERKYIYIN